MTCMRVPTVIRIAILLLAFPCATSVSQETPGELYEKALYLEEARGELSQALDMYGRIMKDFPDDREAAAKSQLHIGLCYEKLGLEKAKQAYQRVIADYPDQKEVVSQARNRLAALKAFVEEPASRKLTVRKVWEGPDVDGTGEISPDGKYLSCVHWDTGDLALYDIAAGKKRFLTDEGSWDDSYAYALGSRWSPDGKRLAYTWHDSSSERVCITDLEGSSHRVLCSTDEDVEWYHVTDWSRDEEHILAVRQLADTTFDVVLISVEDGSVKVVAELSEFEDFGLEMRMSPDGTCIAYDCPTRKDSDRRDLFLLDCRSGKSTPLGPQVGHGRVLGWVPNGTHLLFSSIRTGTPTIWAMRIVGGRPIGRPIMVKETMGPFMPRGLGATRDGAFYFSERPNTTDVFVLETDPASGRLVSAPREAINLFVGSNATPDYSPDGKHLAFVSRRGALDVPYTFRPVGNVLCIRSLETGEVKEINPGFSRFGFPKWAPDSRTIMVANFGRYGWSHHLIDTETGDVTLAVETNDPSRILGHEWAAYGRSVYLIRDEPGETDERDERLRTIVLRNIDTGVEEELWAGKSRELTTISVSPDGRWLAMLGGGLERALKVMPASGGRPRVVHEFTQVNYLWSWHEWSADGRSILLPKPPPSGEKLKWDIWRIPVDGGEPQRLGVEVPQPWQLSAHPDGRHVALSCQGATHGHPQIWVMENYLPEVGIEHEAGAEPMGDASGMRLRKVADVERTVYPQQLGLQGRVSPDGKYLSCVDWETGDLAIFEIATGEMRRVTNKGSWEDSIVNAEGSIWSPDGRRLAYFWWDGDGTSGLCTIGADGSEPHTVLSDTSISWMEPTDWSPDGTAILTMLERKNNTTEIVLVSTGGDSVREILDVSDAGSRGWPDNVCFSPDGKRIAYDLRPGGKGSGHDVCIMSVEDGQRTPLVNHPADDYVLGWSRDGKHLLFASSRTGTYGLYAIAVCGMAAQGEARLLMPGIGPIHPEGMSRDGSLYYHPPFGNRPDVYVVHCDLEAYSMVSSPKKIVTDVEGTSMTPDFSRCGKYLAFVSGLHPHRRTRGGTVLCIRSLETGQTRELRPELCSFGYPRWSPDSRYLYFPAFGREGEQIGTHKIDVRDGTTVPLVTDRPEELRGHVPSSDGKSLLLARQDETGGGWSITVRDLAGESEKELYRVTGEKIYTFALSPDGEQIAVLSRSKAMGSELEIFIRVGSCAGGELKEVCRPERVARHLAWTADGDHILFCTRKASSEKWGLWRVAAAGGVPEDLHTELVGEMRHLTVHPDGRQIAFSSSGPINNAELWAIENLDQELDQE